MNPGERLARHFHPKLLTVFAEGYRLSDLRADSVAGLTVAIVALPLAMALAVASGADPATGLLTAIVAGFLISALGGSRVQVGGPTGAFIPVIYAIIANTALGLGLYGSTGRFILFVCTMGVLLYLIVTLVRWVKTLSASSMRISASSCS